MSVLLPWNRKKEAEQETPRYLPTAPAGTPAKAGLRPFARVLASLGLASVILVWAILRSIPLDAETVWDLEGGRLLAHLGGYYLVAHEGNVWLMDATSAVSRPANVEQNILTLGRRGLVQIPPASPLEKALPPACGDLVLTQRPSQDGQFGETWELTAYRPDGSRRWSRRVLGSAYLHCMLGDRIAVAILDLSAGGAPSVLLMDAGTGEAIWSRSLPPGAFRALGFLDDGTLVAVLSTGAVAFAPNGDTRWTYLPGSPISAAAVIGDATCLAQTENHKAKKLVYPYRVICLSPEGALRWSHAVRQELLSMQEWMGKEAMAGFAENHVLGFRLRDGARLFAERTGASPVSLHEDKLLIRDNRGLRLLRLRSIEKPAS